MKYMARFFIFSLESYFPSVATAYYRVENLLNAYAWTEGYGI